MPSHSMPDADLVELIVNRVINSREFETKKAEQIKSLTDRVVGTNANDAIRRFGSIKRVNAILEDVARTLLLTSMVTKLANSSLGQIEALLGMDKGGTTHSSDAIENRLDQHDLNYSQIISALGVDDFSNLQHISIEQLAPDLDIDADSIDWLTRIFDAAT